MVRTIARATLIAACVLLALVVRPLPSPASGWLSNVLVGLAFAGVALLFDLALEGGRLWGAVGAAGGIALGGLVGVVVSRLLPAGGSLEGLRTFVSLVPVYAGAVAGARIANRLETEHWAGIVGSDRSTRASTPHKIVDTSVIIDGRIADLAETGFLEGVFVVPSFVLRELQYVADAADPLRRARGRRGLETLQRLKKSAAIEVVFSEEEIPEVREVDLKLLELARRMGGKLLTNDYNLNKVASLRGVEVLNLNELANALKPVLLPGEKLTVNILREGKEPHQGVAYLDDGTMVVIEQARGMVGRTADVVVTSVLQTTAGKMFFAKITGAELGQPASVAQTSTSPIGVEPLTVPTPEKNS